MPQIKCIEKMIQQNRIWAIIVAGGMGKRMGTDKPKQYISVCGKPVIHHTLSRVCSSRLIDGVVVGIQEADLWWKSDPFFDTRMLGVYAAGAERVDTVQNGLHYLLEHENVADTDWALVHDAVRPCILQQDIENLVNEAIRNRSGAVLGGLLADTLKRTDENDRVLSTIPRNRFWRTYTPQMFKIRDLINGIDETRGRGLTVTDECMAVEAVGIQPILVTGHPANIKVTVQSDLDLVELYLQVFE